MKLFSRHSLFAIVLFIFYFLPFTFSATFSDQIQDNEKIIYYTYSTDPTLITTEQITAIIYNNEDAHEIKLEGSDGGWARIYLKKDSLLPISVNYYEKSGAITKQLIYKDDEIIVKLNDGKDQYSFPTNKKVYYDMNSFFHLMRGYPVDENEVTFWSFLPEIRRGFFLYAKSMGKETINVNAKKVDCYKIEVGAGGLIESTLFPQKFYFWITVTEPRKFMQFEGRDFFGNLQRTIVVE